MSDKPKPKEPVKPVKSSDALMREEMVRRDMERVAPLWKGRD